MHTFCLLWHHSQPGQWDNFIQLITVIQSCRMWIRWFYMKRCGCQFCYYLQQEPHLWQTLHLKPRNDDVNWCKSTSLLAIGMNMWPLVNRFMWSQIFPFNIQAASRHKQTIKKNYPDLLQFEELRYKYYIFAQLAKEKILYDFMWLCV